jgi:hypothetical protein
MNALRISVVCLALCSLFAGSRVRADDCSEALMAEPCACRSDVRSERELLRRSDNNSPADSRSKARKNAGMKVVQRAKKTHAPSDKFVQTR